MDLIKVKLIPNAPKTEYIGLLGDALKIKISAPPIEGKANSELINFLHKKTNTPKSQITIVSGETARLKLIEIPSLTQLQLEKLLNNTRGEVF